MGSEYPEESLSSYAQILPLIGFLLATADHELAAESDEDTQHPADHESKDALEHQSATVGKDRDLRTLDYCDHW